MVRRLLILSFNRAMIQNTGPKKATKWFEDHQYDVIVREHYVGTTICLPTPS